MRYYGDRVDECGGHFYLRPFEPSAERVTVSLVEVRVELLHYLLYRRAVILCHIHPTLGIEHCPYTRGTLVKLLYDGPPLDNDPAPVVVAKVTSPDLNPLKSSVVIYKLGFLLIYDGIGLYDKLTRAWLMSGSIVTLYILHHNLWLILRVLSLL